MRIYTSRTSKREFSLQVDYITRLSVRFIETFLHSLWIKKTNTGFSMAWIIYNQKYFQFTSEFRFFKFIMFFKIYAVSKSTPSTFPLTFIPIHFVHSFSRCWFVRHPLITFFCVAFWREIQTPNPNRIIQQMYRLLKESFALY